MTQKFDKPERFTKEWWKYVRDYYRWTIITVIAVIIAVSTFVYGKLTKTEPDIKLAMAGNIVLQPENEDKFQLLLDQSVNDINEDGKKQVFRPMYYIYYGATQTGADYQLAMSQKLSVELMAQEAFLFVFDKELANHYVNLPDAAFLKTEKWAEGIPEALLLKDSYGRAYGVSLKNSSMLEQAGIDGSNMYLFIRLCTNDEAKPKYEESVRLAGKLIE